MAARRMQVCLPSPVFPPVTTTYIYGSGVTTTYIYGLPVTTTYIYIRFRGCDHLYIRFTTTYIYGSGVTTTCIYGSPVKTTHIYGSGVVGAHGRQADAGLLAQTRVPAGHHHLNVRARTSCLTNLIFRVSFYEYMHPTEDWLRGTFLCTPHGEEPRLFVHGLCATTDHSDNS